MPAVGLGTFGSDHVTPDQVAQAVKGAAEVGYRHFDCASVYGNEEAVGASLEAILGSGVKREEMWVTSKLWNDKHSEGDVIASCRQSLKDLRLQYLDLYLVHWPFPNFHAPGCDVTSRSPDAKPYIHASYMKTWRKMEELVDMGLVRHIGTSNMTIPKLKLVLRDARIKPAVNEMELHPHFQQPELFKFWSRTASSRSATARSVRPAVRNATARPRTRRPPKIRSSLRSPAAMEFTPRRCASSGRCSADRRRFRFPFTTTAPILSALPAIRSAAKRCRPSPGSTATAA